MIQEVVVSAPREGFEVTGWPLKTILRGRLVFDQGKVLWDRGV
jgi:dihydropyrimidinase